MYEPGSGSKKFLVARVAAALRKGRRRSLGKHSQEPEHGNRGDEMLKRVAAEEHCRVEYWLVERFRCLGERVNADDPKQVRGSPISRRKQPDHDGDGERG